MGRWIQYPGDGSSYYPDPGRLPLSQCERSAADPDYKGISKRGGMGDHHVFARGNPQIQKPVAILYGAIEAFDTKCGRERYE